MGQERTGDQSQAPNEQDEHHQGVEQAGRLKINVHVGDYAGEDEERAADSENPSHRAPALPEQNCDSKQHGNQRDSKAVCPPHVPIRTDDAHLIGKQISANAGHGATNQKFAQTSGCPPDII